MPVMYKAALEVQAKGTGTPPGIDFQKNGCDVALPRSVDRPRPLLRTVCRNGGFVDPIMY